MNIQHEVLLYAISNLKFPFELKLDQIEAVNSWIYNNCKGSVIFSTGTGKTEIAFECARHAAKIFKHKHEVAELNNNANTSNNFQFRILYLIPRLVLIEQNVKRLIKYGISKNDIGVYCGDRKDIREITISTYQSAINNIRLVEASNMIIMDEIHLISETATEYNRILDLIGRDPEKAILGLTATINEQDPRFASIMAIAPPVKKYMIREAVTDGRLAEPRIVPITVNLTPIEEKMYRDISTNITNLSRQLGDFDPKKISSFLKSGGYKSRLAKAWFKNVRERKELLSETQNKLREAVRIVRKHNSEPIMIFSETIKSIRKLEGMLKEVGIEARCIHNEISVIDRKKILEEWGKNFFPLLSVHTLEIGYDIPNVRIAIIISNNSNNNQIAQRIGRVIRKTTKKDYALIYVIFVKDTKDNNILRMAKSTIHGREAAADKQLKLTFFK